MITAALFCVPTEPRSFHISWLRMPKGCERGLLQVVYVLFTAHETWSTRRSPAGPFLIFMDYLPRSG